MAPSKALTLAMLLVANLALPASLVANGQDESEQATVPLHVKRALLSGDRDSALAWLEPAANSGHAEAAFTLAKLYRSGEIVSANDGLALEYLQIASRAGHPRAEALLKKSEQHKPLPGKKQSAFTSIRTSMPGEQTPSQFNWSAPDKHGITPLLYAAQHQRWQWVSWLTTRLGSAQINTKDAFGNTALHYAAQDNALAAARALIDAGSDVQAANLNDITPLHRAVSANALPMAHLLQTAGANPTVKDRNGWSPAMLAQRFDNQDLLKQTNAKASSSETPATTRNAALLRELKANNHSVVLQLLAKGADPNYMGTSGRALSVAAAQGSALTVTALLDAGADPNAADTSTALMRSVRFGHADITALLLAAGANPASVDEHQQTAMHLAALANCGTCITLLIAADAMPNPVDRQGDTPLLLAAKHDSQHALNALLDSALVDVDQADAHGRTALWWAASETHRSTVLKLLNHNAKLIADENGHTPLHLAIGSPEANLHQLFLNPLSSTQILQMSISGNSLLHWAARHNNHAAIVDLLALGVDIDQANAQGDTALHVAARHTALQAATALVQAGASLQRRNHQLISASHLLKQNPDPAWQALPEHAPSELASLWSRISRN